MSKGIGFVAKSDYETVALNAIFITMGGGKKGATGFMEDYTYGLVLGNELKL